MSLIRVEDFVGKGENAGYNNNFKSILIQSDEK